MPALIVSQIYKSFRLGDERLDVLRGVDLTMAPGDSIAIVGPSGCGKSTLLHILGTIDQPDQGHVELNGTNPQKIPDEVSLANFRNAKIGFIFQDHFLLPQLTVLENVLVPALATRTASGDDRQRAIQLLEQVQLQDRFQHRPSQLSGGQRERVAIARSLFNSPELLLADEPTGNLDRRTAGSIIDLLLAMQQQTSFMLITATHSDSLAGAMARRFELIDGKLDGSPNGSAALR